MFLVPPYTNILKAIPPTVLIILSAFFLGQSIARLWSACPMPHKYWRSTMHPLITCPWVLHIWYECLIHHPGLRTLSPTLKAESVNKGRQKVSREFVVYMHLYKGFKERRKEAATWYKILPESASKHLGIAAVVHQPSQLPARSPATLPQF